MSSDGTSDDTFLALIAITGNWQSKAPSAGEFEANRKRKIRVSVDYVAFGGYLECRESHFFD
jgi:hypothetical protein